MIFRNESLSNGNTALISYLTAANPTVNPNALGK